ncbi:dehydrodolichyl diphosphate synthase complex subunit DHDDS-like [Planococcus citri]|uniref:dehydrodolichyl diphosphate synthase complex subunit DHDDS-like n=1 Tax=Planococcus citri TaxID=170843 RepID=UPI0031F8C0DE
MSSELPAPPTSSWINERPISWVHRVCFYFLRWGSIPKHVAIVMDGNRRYAKKKYVEKVEGHQRGFAKLSETLNWCLKLEVFEVTVYAFSIENFKRNKEEVDTLMDLAKTKFKGLIDEWRKLREHGVCIRIIGNMTLLPKDLCTLMLIAMLLTKDNKKGYLNIAFSYTGKDELANTSTSILQGLRKGDIKDIDVTEKFLDQCLYTYQSPHPEILIRTSGEIRLSDFLTWQGSNSYVHFDNVLWPEFSAWNFISAIFCYQHFANKAIKNLQNEPKYQSSPESKKFVDSVQKERMKILAELCNDNEHIDAEKFLSFTPEELYDYYKLYIHVE